MNKNDIFAKDDRQIKPVDVPEWGGSVCIFKPSAALKRQWHKFQKSSDDDDSVLRIARFLCVFLCDEQGTPIFSSFQNDGTFDDTDASLLMKKDLLVLERLTDACIEYHKPPREETLKNSASGQTGDFTSTSPAN